MLASIFILILFLPAAFLPLALDMFFSSTDLSEMGVCLEKPEGSFLVKRRELIGILSQSNNCEDAGCLWEITNQLQVCQ